MVHFDIKFLRIQGQRFSEKMLEKQLSNYQWLQGKRSLRDICLILDFHFCFCFVFFVVFSNVYSFQFYRET